MSERIGGTSCERPASEDGLHDVVGHLIDNDV